MVLTAGVLIGTGLSGVTFSVVSGVLGRAFPPEKRSMALGISAAAGSFGQFAVLPLTQYLLTHIGWYGTLLTLAGVSLLMVPLAAAMVEPIPRAGGSVVVELGPGAGAFTRHIELRLGGRGRRLAVELNGRFATKLARQYPSLEVVCADARHLPELLRERGIGDVDVIVSGLPWVGFDSPTQKALLEAVCAVLGPNGTFVTFGYRVSSWTPPARRFRQLLRREFDEVVIGRTIRLNFPAAFVLYARRPVRTVQRDDQ
jgi:phospholipid N-methyltransferase